MSMDAQPTLDATFAALADPTRRAIVSRLAQGDATVLELAEPFHVSLPAISRHLKVLESAGLITRGRDAQRRPCSLRVDALRVVAEWTEHTRRAWEARFLRLDEYLRELQSAPKTKSIKPPTKRAVKKGRRNDGPKTR
jgi:DNA-binding transcriptional ArsR family regulator